MKTVTALVLTLSLLLPVVASAAGSCGGGYIIAIKEGGFDEDNFFIMIDNSVAANAVGDAYQGGWIRYEATLNGKRLRGIKALAYLAFTGNKRVQAYTSGTSCKNADDLTIYADRASYPEPCTGLGTC